MTLFIKDGYYYIVNRDIGEPLEKFNKRGWFIANQKPQNQEEFNELEILSRILINVKYYNCTYDQILMDKIKKFI